MRFLYIIIALAIVSCSPKAQEDHGHAHDANGGHFEETPRIDFTKWTEKSELFVEFPVLVVGKTSRFAAHFTTMKKHKPITEGKVTVSFISGNSGIKHTVNAPSSPGIFSPKLQPKKAGKGTLIFEIQTPEFSDKIVIKDVEVYADLETARKANPATEDEATISFLKEQAWKMEFKTEPVREMEIYEMISTSGVWKTSNSNSKVLNATASGTVSFANEKIVEGAKVQKGQLLLMIESKEFSANNLNSNVAKAKANFEEAKSNFDRKKELYNSKIIAKSEFLKSKKEFEVAKASYQSLVSNFSSKGKQIRAPFSGFIKNVKQRNGDFVEEGAMLFTISSQQSNILEAKVSASDAEKLSEIQNIWYQPETDSWSNLKKTDGEVLSVGKKVDAENPIVSVIAKVEDAVLKPEGAFTEVQIAVGNGAKGIVVPVNSLLEDYGNYSVIVQLSGETFERRPVIIGKQNGEFVEVKEGLSKEEFVVTKGAYQVKMASMSGQAPAHGHAH
ncbi:efflux RND transporter periplasmic adaptor subunit [Aureivirga sp. CE67]|uniref:efflux RND transporter periplasmic adaptor subunit n=1 Tax=Aureivirga sp. CE67 TaxID=1788983 RepID=UPI0018C98DD7|nr:efflux RND transporter periplasmic adaptor subunit [Aureivirga sp. CE67]